MRVVVPFTRRQDVGRRPSGFEVEYVAMEGDDAYRQLLQRLWRERRDVIVIEAALLPCAAGELETLCACDGRWCSHVTPGISKLTAQLMAWTPTVWDYVLPGSVSYFDYHWFLAESAARQAHTLLHVHEPV